MKLLKMLAVALALGLSAMGAHAEAWPVAVRSLVPEGATVAEEQVAGPFHVVLLALESGEMLELAWNIRGEEPISLMTQTAAQISAEAPQPRDEAEALVRAAYPDADVLFAEEGPDGAKVLYLLSGTVYGKATVLGETIISRSLTCGTYARDGRLTMEGALAALALQRPEAEPRALELDEDDGLLIYEGEAWLSGVEYEFELDARTGRLLEWERD